MDVRYRLCFLVLLAPLLFGCEGSSEEQPEPDSREPVNTLEQVDPEQDAATLAAWQKGHEWLTEAGIQCEQFHEAIEQFLTSPDSDTLRAAQTRWHQCHDQWHRMDPLLALSDSNPGLFGQLEQLTFNIEARPLMPGYLDSLEDYPYSGIVNDVTVNITATSLRQQHGLTDWSDVSLGLHALEFLLWGEHGQRPARDYQPQRTLSEEQRADELSIDMLPENRRRELLRLTSHLLQDDMAKLQQLWQDESNTLWLTYRQMHPSTRLQLLRNSAWQLLNDRLVRDVLASSGDDSVHNNFAGDNLRPLLSALKGLRELFVQSEPPLAQWFAEESVTEEWSTELDNMIERLEAGINRETGIDAERREAIVQQLQLLAIYLQPVAELGGD